MAYSVTLSDGTKLDNLALNGNNFVSSTKLTEGDFKDKLSKVTITDSEGKEEKHKDMVLVQVTQPSNSEWWFILADKSEDQVKQEQLKQSIASLTDMMMTLSMSAASASTTATSTDTTK